MRVDNLKHFLGIFQQNDYSISKHLNDKNSISTHLNDKNTVPFVYLLTLYKYT